MGVTLLDHLEVAERAVRDLFRCITDLEHVEDQGLLDLSSELSALTLAADAVTDMTEAIELAVMKAEPSDRIVGPIKPLELIAKFAVGACDG